MKKFLTFLAMAMIVSVAAYAQSFTKPASKVTQDRVTAEIRDIRGTGGSNQAPYVEFTNNSGQPVKVEMKVYFGGKEVDNKTVSVYGKTHKEVFSSIASLKDKFKQKKFTVSIRVIKSGSNIDDNM